MDTVGLLLVVLVFLVMCGVFVYFYHKLMDKAMMLNHEAWKHAIHAQDDAWQRMNHERVTSMHSIQNLTQWNAALTKQAVDSGNREVNEARRYMEVTKNELIAAVGKQVRYEVLNAAINAKSAARVIPSDNPAVQRHGQEDTHVQMRRAGAAAGA